MMTWPATLGLIVALAAPHGVVSLPKVAQPLEQEASFKSLGITHQGNVHHVSHGKTLMRAESTHGATGGHETQWHEDDVQAASEGHGADMQAEIGTGGYLENEADRAELTERDVETGSDDEPMHKTAKHHRKHAQHKEHRHEKKHRKHGADHVSTDREDVSVDQAPAPDAKGFSSMNAEAMQHSLHHAQETTQEQGAPGSNAALEKHQPHSDAGEHGEFAQTDSEFLPALGLSNPSDLAYRAMDMMMGIASIIPEDYPYVCICLDTGTCDENMPEDKKTQCPSRIGQKAAASRAPLGLAAMLAAAAAALRG